MATEVGTVRQGMSVVPVDVEKIIRELGIDYEAVPMEAGDSGLIEHRQGRFKISVNSREGPQRQRFTAAHELAHYLLHRDLLMKKGGLNRHNDTLFDELAATNPTKPFTSTHEVQANKLAAEILMPAEAVRAAYDAKSDNVDEVATNFRVSRAAMEIRLKTLGLRPRN